MQLADLDRFPIKSKMFETYYRTGNSAISSYPLPPPPNITYILHYIDIAIGRWVGGGGQGRGGRDR